MSVVLRAMCFFVWVDRLPERARKKTDVSRLLPDQQESFQTSMLAGKPASDPRAMASKRWHGRQTETFDRHFSLLATG